jgi:hypothetical protein
MTDFGLGFDESFDGRVAVPAKAVEKYNRFHDRLGRFASHGAHTDTGHGASVDHARESFKATMRKHLERMSGHGKPGERDLSEMHVEIEAGGAVRDEIARRTFAVTRSDAYVKRDRELAAAVERTRTAVRPSSNPEWSLPTWESKNSAEMDQYNAETAFNTARMRSPVADRLNAEAKALQGEHRSVLGEIEPHRKRLQNEYLSQHGGDGTYSGYLAERKYIEDNLPRDLVARRDAISARQEEIERHMFEARNVGLTHATVHGRGNSSTPSKIVELSVDNPFRVDPEFMRRAEERDAARAAYKKAKREHSRARRESAQTRAEILGSGYKESLAALIAFRGDTRRGVIKEVLSDAGVRFSEGHVLLHSESDMPSVDAGNAIRTFSSKRSKAISSLETVAPYFPANWVRHTETIGISWNAHGRGFYSSGTIETAAHNTTMHEMVHSFETSVPGLIDYEKEFYAYRTSGGELQQLKKLQPGYRYRAHERAIPDKFYDAYCGKSYEGRFYELMTMGYSDIMFPRKRTKEIDPEYEAWVWGVIMRTS